MGGVWLGNGGGVGRPEARGPMRALDVCTHLACSRRRAERVGCIPAYTAVGDQGETGC